MLSNKILLLGFLFFLLSLFGESNGIFGWSWRRRFNNNGGLSRNEQKPLVLNKPITPMRRYGQRIGSSLFNIDNIVKFKLWTRDNPKIYKDLDLLLKSSNVKTKSENDTGVITGIIGFDPKKPTKIIIHGFMESFRDSRRSGEESWIMRMKNEYLEKEDVNVIVMDYSLIGLLLFYLTSVPERTGLKLASTITSLEEKTGVSLDTFHIIGRSWGAHIAGMAGHALNGKLGRISGVDPIGPMLRYIQDPFRLDQNDAQFVDIYHLSGPLSIYFQPRGHVEIYKNIEERASGCPDEDLPPIFTFICGRTRGVKSFTETIKNPKAYPLCPCKDYQDYIEGRCDCTENEYVYMGEHMSNSTRGVYQLAMIQEDYSHDKRKKNSAVKLI